MELFNFDNIKKWFEHPAWSFVLGLIAGGVVVFMLMDYTSKDNKETTSLKIKDLEDEIKELKTEIKELKQLKVKCDNEKVAITNEIHKNYVSRQEYNSCITANNQFAQSNRDLVAQNAQNNQTKINKCIQEREKWQKDLDSISWDLQHNRTLNSFVPLTEQQLFDRREQYKNLSDLLKNQKC